MFSIALVSAILSSITVLLITYSMHRAYQKYIKLTFASFTPSNTYTPAHYTPLPETLTPPESPDPTKDNDEVSSIYSEEDPPHLSSSPPNI